MRLYARDDQGSECRDGAPGPPGFERLFREHYPAVVRLAQTVVGTSRRRRTWLRRGTAAAPRRAYRFRPVSVRTGVVIGVAGLVVAGTAAAATLTTVFAPMRVAALSLPSAA